MKKETHETFDPRTCISGKIMRVTRLIANVFRKYLQDLNVTNSQISILFILSKKREISQKELSQIAKLEKSSLSRNLTRLIDKGYLLKLDSSRIKITSAGLDFVNEIIPHWNKAMNEIREILGEEGEQALSLLHQKLTE